MEYNITTPVPEDNAGLNPDEVLDFLDSVVIFVKIV